MSYRPKNNSWNNKICTVLSSVNMQCQGPYRGSSDGLKYLNPLPFFLDIMMRKRQELFFPFLFFLSKWKCILTTNKNIQNIWNSNSWLDKTGMSTFFQFCFHSLALILRCMAAPVPRSHIYKMQKLQSNFTKLLYCKGKCNIF